MCARLWVFDCEYVFVCMCVLCGFGCMHQCTEVKVSCRVYALYPKPQYAIHTQTLTQKPMRTHKLRNRNTQHTS